MLLIQLVLMPRDLKKLSPLVTIGLLGVNRHFQCNSIRSLISAFAELLLIL